ncbi:acetyl-CoA acetyltransferase [Alkalihalophilus pseudofirmus OF4]|uniref:acetyl-CoA C-acetyltransferase n=1 Tax=Alkalihalophilus pseudofirmus (strain ATCC BAA-2126 / JCM 17055 / OF4) TaxID=398511 RepID=D3FXX5_ALKPO|nr:thiolase family protein [Alkalihalophilus pseudofirmus]ADC50734.1 acetyl-CoA acetyltransferase [Alkalihalophilus pseudofirmus OF4]
MECVIVAGKRSAFGKFGGSLKDFSTVQLSQELMKGVLLNLAIAPEEVQEVNWGVCTQAEAKEVIAPIIARQALLKAGLSPQTISQTIDQACCSGLAALKQSYYSIKRAESEVVLAGGAEVMSRTPMVVPALRWGNRMGHMTIHDPAYGIRYHDFNLVSQDAAEVALEYGIDRNEQDEFAYMSQLNWERANSLGKFKAEIYPLVIEGSKKEVIFDMDEAPRPGTTLQKLASLPTVFDSPTITAGNAPGLSDGACSMVLMKRDTAMEKGITPLAEVMGVASVADDPRNIATVPGRAIQKVLKEANLSIDTVKVIEINEAFAAVPLVSSLVIAEGDKEKAMKIREKMNVNGGAIALGHPVGASGARIVLTLMNELKRQGGGYGVASICGGLAQGEAILIKVDP